jgi:hypothetical protein
MDLDSVGTAVKWVLLVLLAGFVAQFGKRFADRLIEKRKRDKAGFSPPRPSDAPPARGERETVPAGQATSEPGLTDTRPVREDEGAATGKLAEKAAKKAAKAALKRQKKGAETPEE